MRRFFNIPIICGLASFCAAFAASLLLFDSDLSAVLFSSDVSAIMQILSSFLSPPLPHDGTHIKLFPYFPDLPIYLLADLFPPVHFRLAAYFFMLTLLQTIGWTLLCRRLGASWELAAVPFFLQSAQFLFLAYSGGDILILPLVPGHHGGLWALIPYLLLAVTTLHRPRMQLLFFLLLFAASASDPIVVVWFVAPCAASVVIFWFCRALPAGYCLRFFALSVAAVFAGNQAAAHANLFHFSPHEITSIALNPQLALIPRQLRNIAHAAAQYPHLAFLHLAFSAILLWLFALHMRELRLHALRLRVRVRDDLAGSDAAVTFCAVFLPAMMAAAFCGQMWYAPNPLDAGEQSGYVIGFWAFRHSMPFAYLPLFAGWSLLPLLARPFLRKAPAPPPRNWRQKAPVAAMAALCAAAAPAIASLPERTLSPLETPYMLCLREHAEELKWTGGIGNYLWWDLAILADDIPLVRQLPMKIVGWHKANPLAAYADHDNHLPMEVPGLDGRGVALLGATWREKNRHQFTGEFQVVAINRNRGRYFRTLPRRASDSCAVGACGLEDDNPRTIDERAALEAFGEPAKIVECEGVGLWHYDPPLRFDFSQYKTLWDYPRVIWQGDIRHAKFKLY